MILAGAGFGNCPDSCPHPSLCCASQVAGLTSLAWALRMSASLQTSAARLRWTTTSGQMSRASTPSGTLSQVVAPPSQRPLCWTSALLWGESFQRPRPTDRPTAGGTLVFKPCSICQRLNVFEARLLHLRCRACHVCVRRVNLSWGCYCCAGRAHAGA